MPWQDLGHIFGACGQAPWMTSHGYVPTALTMDDRIRVFTAFWDAESVGRVGYVDVRPEDPTTVMSWSAQPALNVGPTGAFDEHGVTPMSVEAVGDEIWLHYAGWQRSPSVRYFLFTGLAISRDGGKTFERRSNVPVLDRTADHLLVRTGFMRRNGDRWQAWVAESVGIVHVAGKPTPRYRLGFMESPDGVSWPSSAEPCFETRTGDVFGYGRSAVWRQGDEYRGLFSVRRLTVGYRIEFATSPDGLRWSPLSPDGMAFLPQQAQPPQSEVMFPSLVRSRHGMLMFYNGDDFGRDGVRVARWID